MSTLKEIIKSEEKYFEKSVELQSSISFDGGVQMELAMLQQTIENIKNNLEEVEVIKKWHGGYNKVRNVYKPFIRKLLASYRESLDEKWLVITCS